MIATYEIHISGLHFTDKISKIVERKYIAQGLPALREHKWHVRNDYAERIRQNHSLEISLDNPGFGVALV